MQVDFLTGTLLEVLSVAWPGRFFPFFFGVAEKRVWTSSQAALVLTLPHGTGSVNKRNLMHTHLVAASAC